MKEALHRSWRQLARQNIAGPLHGSRWASASGR
jgi:hypothetical protein